MTRQPVDGQLLRTVRENKLMTMTELARRAGLSNTTLTRIEVHGVQPSRITLLKILGALGVEVAEITAADPSPADAR